MALVSPFPHAPFPYSSPHMQQQSRPLANDEEDLMALFSSDTFSLESQRDRELLHLSSFLQTALPPGSSPPQPSNLSGGNSTSQWISGPDSSHSAGGAAWNGWRADVSTSTQHYGSANQHPTATPHGTPLSHTLALPDSSPSSLNMRDGSTDWSRRGGRVGSDGYATAPGTGPTGTGMWGGSTSSGGGGLGLGGCRAPAVSREREGGAYGRQASIDEASLQLPSYQQTLAGAGGMVWGAGEPVDEEGGKDYRMEDDDDGMDGGEQVVSDERPGRYAVNTGWGTAA